MAHGDSMSVPLELEDGIGFGGELFPNLVIRRGQAILRKWASEFSPNPLPLQLDASQIDDMVDRLLPPISNFTPIPNHAVKFCKPDSAENNGEQDTTLDAIEKSVKFGIWMSKYYPDSLSRPYDEKTILAVLDNRVLPPYPHAPHGLSEAMSFPDCGLWLLRSISEAFVSYGRRVLGIERQSQPTWLARLFLKGLLRHVYGMFCFHLHFLFRSIYMGLTSLSALIQILNYLSTRTTQTLSLDSKHCISL